MARLRLEDRRITAPQQHQIGRARDEKQATCEPVHEQRNVEDEFEKANVVGGAFDARFQMREYVGHAVELDETGEAGESDQVQVFRAQFRVGGDDEYFKGEAADQVDEERALGVILGGDQGVGH